MAIVDTILAKLIDVGGSDAHFMPGVPPTIRRYGRLFRIPAQPLTPEHTALLLDEVLEPEQRTHLAAHQELDFAYDVPGLGRFRGNAFQERRGLAFCFRAIPSALPSFEVLGLPAALRKVCETRQGLVLVTGPAGSGKSTTLAALVDHLNATQVVRLVTVEDPIEYLHPVKRGAISQRQVARHTRSFASAVRAALREDPDVLSVGELRDLETISLAIGAAETGHLVLASINTTSSRKTIDRLVDVFPERQQNQTRSMLSESLRAVFSQRLIPRLDGTGMALAFELLLGSPQLGALIRENKTFQVPNLLQTGKSQGLISLDDSLLELLDRRTVAAPEALRLATHLSGFERYRTEAADSLFFVD